MQDIPVKLWPPSYKGESHKMKGCVAQLPAALWGSVEFLSCPGWTDVYGAEMWLHIENSPRDGITCLPRQKQFSNETHVDFSFKKNLEVNI